MKKLWLYAFAGAVVIPLADGLKALAKFAGKILQQERRRLSPDPTTLAHHSSLWEA